MFAGESPFHLILLEALYQVGVSSCNPRNRFDLA